MPLPGCVHLQINLCLDAAFDLTPATSRVVCAGSSEAVKTYIAIFGLE